MDYQVYKKFNESGCIYMCKINCKRGYKRYSDFNHNRLVILVKGWYGDKLMIDFYLNEKYLGYVTTEASWADFFSSSDSDIFVNSLMQKDSNLAEYSPEALKMKLFEDNTLFVCEPFNLYATIPYRQKAILKVCNPTDSNEQIVLQERELSSVSYQGIYEECLNYMKCLEQLVAELSQ